MTNRTARLLGPLLVTTARQSEGGPRIDGARVSDAEGRTYGALVFGAGNRAPVIGWRGVTVPPPARIVLASPRPLRPVARWLFGPRWAPVSPAGSAWLGRHLRTLADRVDHAGAPKLPGWSFTFEEGEGIRWRRDGRGCPVAYLGDDAYARAHDESDSGARRIDWAAVTADGPLRGRVVPTVDRGRC